MNGTRAVVDMLISRRRRIRGTRASRDPTRAGQRGHYVVEALRAGGHEVVPIARSLGVDVIAGPQEEDSVELAKRFVARRGDNVRIEGVSDPNDPDSVLNQTGALLPGPTAVHPDRSCAHHNRCPHQGGALCEGTLWGVLKAD